MPGGADNTADGLYSYAAGHKATANNRGCFVWGDDTGAFVECNNDNPWVVRAGGGVYFYSNGGLSSGAFLAAGANSWSGVSDRTTKENFATADSEAIRRLGPVAQDFHAAFDCGEDKLAINLQDADGVALAAIQGLYRQVQEKDQQIENLENQMAGLEDRLAAMEGDGDWPLGFGGWGVVGSLVLAAGGWGLVAGRRQKAGRDGA